MRKNKSNDKPATRLTLTTSDLRTVRGGGDLLAARIDKSTPILAGR